MRCVNMLSRLWNSPDHEEATGTSTTGFERGRDARGHGAEVALARPADAPPGKPTDQPNMVMGANVQVCWEKFCRYWDVEARLVPMEGERYHLTADEAVKLLRREHDRRRRGARLDVRRQLRAGRRDLRRARPARRPTPGSTSRCTSTARRAASSRPFLDPELVWDFRLPRVQSINASGHKYGLVYPGVGWVDLAQPRGAARRPRVQRQLPRRRHADVRAELLAAGQPGRRAVLQLPAPRLRGLPRACSRRRATSRCTSPSEIGEMDHFELITDGSELPVFAFTLKPGIEQLHRVRRVASACASAAGWSPPTRSPRTARTSPRCASSCATASPATSPTCSSPTSQRHTAYFDKLTSPLPDAAGKSFSH